MSKLVTGSQLKQLGANLWNGVKKVYNDFTGNTQIDKSIAAQKDENAKAYAANLAQWQRENAYNHPAAQKARLISAGINADMMYGNGNLSNVAASSPQYGAADMSAIAGKMSVGQALREGLQTEMARAQVNKIKADTKKTLADAGLSEISLEYADAKERLGLAMSEKQYEIAKQDYELAVNAVQKSAAELEGLTLDNAWRAIRNAFGSEEYQAKLKIMAQELDIKTAEAAHAMEYYAARLLGLQADNAWKDAGFITRQPDGVPTLIKYGAEIFPDLISNIWSWVKPGKGKKPKSFNKMKQSGNVIEWTN